MKVAQPWGGTWIELTPQEMDSFYRGSCIVLQRSALNIARPVDETVQPDVDRNAMCGSSWLSWALACTGLDVSAEDLETWMRNTYGEPGVHGGVTTVQLASAAQAFGCPSTVTNASPSTLIGQVFGVCVWCTPYAVPCTETESRAISPPYGLGHFIGPVPNLSSALKLLPLIGDPMAPVNITDLSDDVLWGVVMEAHLRITGGAMTNPNDVNNEIAGIKGAGFSDPATGAKYPGGWSGYVTYLQNLPQAKALRAQRGW